MAGFDDISRFFLEKFIFPKKVLLDNPGFIVNKTMRKYGGTASQHRAVLIFEDILSSLQEETISVLGDEKARLLWYKTGKDVALRYLLIGNVKPIPSFLETVIIQYVFEGFNAGGQSFAKEITFDSNSKKLILKGENNLVCRNAGVGEFSAGLTSGVLSNLIGRNVEAKIFCNCPHCFIVADTEFPEVYVPKQRIIDADYNLYSKLNFPKFKENQVNSNNKLISFNDLLKFKKLIVEKDGKYFYKGKCLVVGEVGVFEIIADNFISAVSKEKFEKIVFKSSEDIADVIFSGISEGIQKLDFLIGIFSGFGMGILSYTKKDKKLILNVQWTPYYQSGFYFQNVILRGFLHYIYGEKMVLTSEKFDLRNSTTVFEFSNS